MSKALSSQFIQSLLEEFTPPDAIGLGLVGSFSRGKGGPFSDVDLDIFVSQMPNTKPERYNLHQRSGHLVSMKKIGLEAQRAELRQPETAIWAVPGLREMQILHDPHGKLAGLKAEAEEFDWAGLEAAANSFVSYDFHTCTEEVYKLLGGLKAHDPSKVMYATLGLGLGLAETMAVHKRLLVESENRYFDLLYTAVGKESPWSRAHRLAVGWRAGAFERRGIAALQLYWESFVEFKEVIAEEHLGVIQPALVALQESGHLARRV